MNKNAIALPSLKGSTRLPVILNHHELKVIIVFGVMDDITKNKCRADSTWCKRRSRKAKFSKDRDGVTCSGANGAIPPESLYHRSIVFEKSLV
jgi:hypothetical protein